MFRSDFFFFNLFDVFCLALFYSVPSHVLEEDPEHDEGTQGMVEVPPALYLSLSSSKYLYKMINRMEVAAIKQFCILCKIAYQGEARKARTLLVDKVADSRYK